MFARDAHASAKHNLASACLKAASALPAGGQNPRVAEIFVATYCCAMCKFQPTGPLPMEHYDDFKQQTNECATPSNMVRIRYIPAPGR